MGARPSPTESSSDRSFGLVFAGFFALLAAYGWWHASGRWPLWLAIAAVFLIAALLRPQVLSPLNRLWTKLGYVLGMVVSPVVLGLIFFVVMAPLGLLMRLLRKDTLRLRRDPEAGSYWIERQPPGPPGETLRDQF
jgi:saxitoxin biosynthesis operon SxtJ-like protein